MIWNSAAVFNAKPIDPHHATCPATAHALHPGLPRKGHRRPGTRLTAGPRTDPLAHTRYEYGTANNAGLLFWDAGYASFSVVLPSSSNAFSRHLHRAE